MRIIGPRANAWRMYWCAAQLAGHHERLALYCLGLRGFETYLPRIRSPHAKLKATALFPGYCFIRIALQWHEARWAPGVTRLIQNGRAEPTHVPDAVIDGLRARERNGLVVLPPPAQAAARLRSGDRVRISTGPLSGFVGLVQGIRPRQRVEILLQLLGRVELAEADVERVRIVSGAMPK